MNYTMSVDDYDLIEQAKEIQARIRRTEKLSFQGGHDAIGLLTNFVSVIAERHTQLAANFQELQQAYENLAEQLYEHQAGRD